MAEQKLVSLIAVAVIVTPEGRYEPGRPFGASPKLAERLLRKGAATRAQLVVSAPPPAPEPDDDDEGEGEGEVGDEGAGGDGESELEFRPGMTRAQLEEVADQLGIDVDKLQGSGARGKVTNRDIEEAIAQEQAARAAGQSSANPSIVS